MADSSIPMAMAPQQIQPTPLTPVNPNIPMAVEAFKPIDEAANTKKAYELADAIGEFNEAEQARRDAANDRAILAAQQASGLQLHTFEGLKKIYDNPELMSKLSPKAQQGIIKTKTELELHDLTVRKSLGKLTEDELERLQAEVERTYMDAQVPLKLYKEALKDGMPIAEAEAVYKARVKEIVDRHSLPNPVTGKALLPAEKAEEMLKASPAELEERLRGVGAFQKQLKQEAERRELEAKAEFYKAGTTEKISGGKEGVRLQNLDKILADPATSEEAKTAAEQERNALLQKGNSRFNFGAASLTSEQNAAISQAIVDKRLDPNKVNSRTAGLLADILLKEPGIDMAGISAKLNLARNPAFQTKALTADALPEVLNSMTEAGKKIGFSDVRTVGKMQAWFKGELNDPDFTEYMVLRNDGLMSIASTMRGVGMTDMAHKAEIEASSPTMSPAALEAWLRGQMRSLEPRLKRYTEITASKETKTGEDQHKTLKDSGQTFTTETEIGQAMQAELAKLQTQLNITDAEREVLRKQTIDKYLKLRQGLKGAA